MTGDAPYKEFAPPSALAEEVACFWTATPVAQPERQHPHQQRVLPDGCVDVIFDLTVGSAKVIGTMTKAIVVPENGHALLAVRFQPGAARRFFRLPVHELTDHSVPLQAFWNNGEALAERLAIARGTTKRLQAFAQELNRRKQHSVATAKVTNQQVLTCSIVRALSHKNTDDSVAEIARQHSVSRQHLTRQFKQSVGISPKQFQRVMRMQRLVGMAWQPHNAPAFGKINWAVLASDCGYFDQAHMIADFKDLCGVTPAAYFGR